MNRDATGTLIRCCFLKDHRKCQSKFEGGFFVNGKSLQVPSANSSQNNRSISDHHPGKMRRHDSFARSIQINRHVPKNEVIGNLRHKGRYTISNLDPKSCAWATQFFFPNRIEILQIRPPMRSWHARHNLQNCSDVTLLTAHLGGHNCS